MERSGYTFVSVVLGDELCGGLCVNQGEGCCDSLVGGEDWWTCGFEMGEDVMKVYIVMDLGEVMGVYRNYESFKAWMLRDFAWSEKSLLGMWEYAEEYEVR